MTDDVLGEGDLGHHTAAPRANRDPDEVAYKLGRLDEAHIAPLTQLVRRLRVARGGDELVPYFDPTEAGTQAPILVLLEAPGRRAVTQATLKASQRGSGFISADNDDQTAANMWRFLREAGIERSRELVTWNVIPWYVGDGDRIRSVTKQDIHEAEPALVELLGLLPELRVVVLLGRQAERAWRVAGIDNDLPVLTAPHPSPRNVNGRPEARQRIVDALKAARLTACDDIA